MENQNRSVLSEEQLDALAQNLLPAMREFFSSESGKKIWADQLEGIAPEKNVIYCFKALTIIFECGIIILLRRRSLT